jgi:large subunit ribosomal protein L28
MGRKYQAAGTLDGGKHRRNQAITSARWLDLIDWFASLRRPKPFPLWADSANIRSQVKSTIYDLWSEATMALACEMCGKKPLYGNAISHAHNVTRRRWNPNLRRVKAVVKGARKHIRVCTSCIRSGRVQKAA